jgi:hypothetical protein
MVSPRKAVEVWGRALALTALVLLLVGIPLFFMAQPIEATFENVAAFVGYGVLSLGLWGFVIFAAGALPIALVVWLLGASRKRASHSGDVES